MKPDQVARLRHLAALWLSGGCALASTAWMCFWLGLNFAATAFAYLIVVVVLSLVGSRVSSIIFSLIAIASLNYLFVEPRFTFQVKDAEDLTALAAFLASSLVVTGLVRRLRDLGDAQRDQAQRLARATERDVHWRRQAAHVAEAQKLSLTGSFGWSVGTGEVFWSEESFRIFGYDPATKPSIEAMLARVHPDDSARVRQVMEGAGRDRQDLDLEHRLLLPDGSVRHVRVMAWPLASEHGAPQLAGALMDVTVRRTTEEALRYSEHRYTNLFQAMAASFWELDFSGVDGMLRGLLKSGVTDFRAYLSDNPEFVREMMRRTRVVDVNDQTVAMFGRGSKAELLGSVEPFWPEESTQAYAEGVLAGVDRKHSFSVECKLRRIDGSLFDALFTSAYPPDTMGKGSLMVGVIDVTERKRAYAELERSEQRYRYLFDHMPIALWQLNARALAPHFKRLRAEGITDLGRYFDEHPDFLAQCMDALLVDEVNEYSVQMLGARDRSDFAGPVTRYWAPSPDTFRRAMEARYRGEPTFEEETRILAHDGRVIDVLFKVARPGTALDPAMSLIGLIDIAERVRAQEMLQRVQADFAHAARVSVLGELTASIAHEVNQPLAAIATNGEAGLRWLAGPQPDLAEVSEIIGEVVADARRASDIIARVRAMAVRQAPAKTLVSLDEVIREALLFLRHEIQARAVSISHRPAPGAPRILADRTQLQQVIVNLAVNAMQAMASVGSKEPRVIIHTAVPDSATLCCTVEDSGPGLSSEHVGRLFDSFFTTKDSGMGMGLPICRSIIEAHGGRIAADNQSAGGGARFSFTLPAAEPASRSTN
jgi:PAS domain S-box-containing protein